MYPAHCGKNMLQTPILTINIFQVLLGSHIHGSHRVLLVPHKWESQGPPSVLHTWSHTVTDSWLHWSSNVLFVKRMRGREDFLSRILMIWINNRNHYICVGSVYIWSQLRRGHLSSTFIMDIIRGAGPLSDNTVSQLINTTPPVSPVSPDSPTNLCLSSCQVRLGWRFNEKIIK